jgi:D-beta-D-heptose 7-phosphate kinase/D-beta-D-heptose 1-phosphate adenosyltransferase
MVGPRAGVVVVGDALLDADLTGRADRLAPDAPVPVLDALQEELRPGGAALAAVLAARDGRQVTLVAGTADDDEGHRLVDLVSSYGVEVVQLPLSGRTSVKRRVRAAGQSLLRLDSGGNGALGEPPAEVATLVEDAGAVLVADYGQGVARHPVLRAMLERAARRTSVVWDPHLRGPTPVPGSRLVTPNSAESAALVPDRPEPGLAADADRADQLLVRWRAHAVAVTLGSRGALLAQSGSSPSVVPARAVRAQDSCGAGDCFAAAAAAALADGAVTVEAVQDAVGAAAEFVSAGGAAGLQAGESPTAGLGTVERTRAAGGTVVATGGCFDLLHAGHVATLEAARSLGDCLVVCLNSDASVRRLKGPGRPVVPAVDRAQVLAALGCVDEVVVFDEDTPAEALQRLRPHVWAKGGDYAGAVLPEAELLGRWGGTAVVLPYLDGRSTTGLVAALARS